MSLLLRTRALIAFFALPALVVVGSSCATSQNVAPGVSSEEEPVSVRVDNQYRNDITLYVVRNGDERRLGRVRSYQSGRFRLPSTYVGTATPVYLRAEPMGSTDPVDTEALFPEAGMTIVWNISNYLANSIVEVSH